MSSASSVLSAVSSAARAALERVSGDGLTADEVTSVISELTAQFPQAEVLEAIGAFADQFAPANVERLERALQKATDGGQIFDANKDGKLDRGDLLLEANGKVRPLGEVLKNRALAGAAVLEAAEAMVAANFTFELIKNHRCNEQFWEKDLYGTFSLKPGVKPSEALKDFFENSSKYGFECATALVLTYYRAILNRIGPEDFDRACADLVIGPWKYEDDFRKVLLFDGNPYLTATEADRLELEVGDYTYIRNSDVSPEGKEGGWQGENVIYLGKNELGELLFYGHPFGICTEAQIIEELNKFRNPNSTTPAAMVGAQGNPNPEFLAKLDQSPS